MNCFCGDLGFCRCLTTNILTTRDWGAINFYWGTLKPKWCFLFDFCMIEAGRLLLIITAIACGSPICMTAVAATEGAVAINLLEQRSTEATIGVYTDTIGLLLLAVGAWEVRQHLFQHGEILHTVWTVTVNV